MHVGGQPHHDRSARSGCTQFEKYGTNRITRPVQAYHVLLSSPSDANAHYFIVACFLMMRFCLWPYSLYCGGHNFDNLCIGARGSSLSLVVEPEYTMGWLHES